MPIEEMSAEDSALLEHEAANKLWQWLAGRFPQKRLTPDSDLRVDLGVDSLEWLHLTLEIGALTKVELSEKAVAEIETVRDLLRAVAESAGRGKAQPQGDPFKEPEKVLDREQKRWLEPLGPGARWAALLLFGLTRFLMRVLFHVRAQGIENLPEQGPYVLTPNHVSYLDPFALAAVLSDQQLRETYWAGWTGAAFGNWFTRAVSRLGQAVPIDPEGGIVSSLAFCAAVLKRKKNLVWFPEGMRSPTGKLLDFKPGIGTLLSHFQVPVVPVFIHGTAKAMPVGKLLPRRKRVTVVFGKPQDPSALGGRHDGEKEPERIAQALHDRVAALGK